MAFNMDFSKSREALGRITQFLQYDMMQKRASERQQKQALLENSLATQLSEQKFSRDVELEAFRSSNTRAEDTNKKVLEVLMLPEFDGPTALLNMARAGKLGPDPENGPYGPAIKHSKEVLQGATEEIGQSLFNIAKGTATPENMKTIVKFWGNKSNDIAKELGISHRAVLQNEIDKETNRIRDVEVKNKATENLGKLTPFQESEIKSIEEAQAHIISQGVVPFEAGMKANVDFMGAATGKAFDTYNSDVAGQYKEALEALKDQVRSGKPLNDIQKRFKQSTYNAFRYRSEQPKPVKGENKSGNVVSPVTGMSSTGEQQSAERAKGDDRAYWMNYYLNKKHPPPYTDIEMARAGELADIWMSNTQSKKK